MSSLNNGPSVGVSQCFPVTWCEGRQNADQLDQQVLMVGIRKMHPLNSLGSWQSRWSLVKYWGSACSYFLGVILNSYGSEIPAIPTTILYIHCAWVKGVSFPVLQLFPPDNALVLSK